MRLTRPAGVTVAVNIIRDLSKAKYDVEKEDQWRYDLLEQLQVLLHYLKRLEPFQRLKTDRLTYAVGVLQQTVCRQLQRLQELPAAPQSRPWRWLRTITACCVGPSAMFRAVQAAAQEVCQQIDLVQAQAPDALNEDNIPLVKQALLSKPLPDHFQRPAATLDKLKQKILQVAAAAPAGGPPPVVQLLGMPGMGKSTLALALAKELEKEGDFTGGVYFLTPEPYVRGALLQGSLNWFEHQKNTNRVIQDLQLYLLDSLSCQEYGAGVSSHNILHSRLNFIFAHTLSSRSHLLILDDVFDPCILPQLRFENMSGVVLVTARQPVCIGATTMRLDGNDAGLKDAAYSLLTALLDKNEDELTPIQKKALHEVVDLCESNPLAVRLFAEVLKSEVSDKAWQGWLGMARDYTDSRLATAVQASLDDMYGRVKAEGGLLHTALMMLQHLQPRVPLPPRLLGLLWSHLHPKEVVSITSLMEDLVERSWVTKQQCTTSSLLQGYRVSAMVGKYLQGLPVQPLQLSTAPQQGISSATYHLAALLLIYGGCPAVRWAQELLGVPVPDGVPVLLGEHGQLLQPLLLEDSSPFCNDQNKLKLHEVNSWLCELYTQTGQQDRAVHFSKACTEVTRHTTSFGQAEPVGPGHIRSHSKVTM